MLQDNYFVMKYFGKNVNFDELDNNMFREILKCIHNNFFIKTIMPLKKLISNNSEKMDILREVLESRKMDFAQSLLTELGPEIKEKYYEGLSIIIDELLENENVSIADIDYINEGSFSKVYKIGDKVLKIGFPRLQYEIPNHPRIAQPLLRRNLKRDTGTVAGCIEISRYADMIDKNEPGVKKEVYELYRDLRKAGLICTDMRLSNLGRVRESNTNLYKIKRNGEEPLNVAPNSAGLEGELEGDIIQKGQLVIIDTDCIFREDDEGLCYLDDVTILEELYQAELKGLKPDYNRVILDDDELTPEI